MKDLVREYDIIISEKLNINSMENKIKRKYYYQVDTYFPSSKMCSHCGEKTTKTNNLGVREWECENCGWSNDRDINASINIMFEGLKYYYSN